jgi:7-carboxy-7-deazaguanine synthase
MTKLRISEIFGLVVQGEGPMIGRPTLFIRTGGCDYRCIWCDTAHAVLPQFKGDWTGMTVAEIMEAVADLALPPALITLSGGNPALQDFGPLIREASRCGYRFCCETQGSKAADWFARLDDLVLSPKPPSSEMVTDWDVLAECVALGNRGKPGLGGTALKVVIFDDADYEYARQVSVLFPSQPLFLQVGNPTPPRPDGSDPGFDPLQSLADLRALMERVCRDGWHRARVLPQLHTLAYGNLRGV